MREEKRRGGREGERGERERGDMLLNCFLLLSRIAFEQFSFIDFYFTVCIRSKQSFDVLAICSLQCRPMTSQIAMF